MRDLLFSVSEKMLSGACRLLALLSQSGTVGLSVTVSVLGPSVAPAGLSPLAFLSDATLR